MTRLFPAPVHSQLWHTWKRKSHCSMVTACGNLAHFSAQSYVTATWIAVSPSSSCSKGTSLTDTPAPPLSTALLAVAVCICLSVSRLPLLKLSFQVRVVLVLEVSGGREHSAHGASYSYDESIDSQKNEALSGTREFAAMPQMERPIPSQHGLAAV